MFDVQGSFCVSNPMLNCAEQVIALQSELKELKQEKMNFEGTLEKTR